MKKTFNISTDVSIRQGAEGHRLRTYTVGVSRHEDAMRVLQATKLIDRYGEIEENLSLAQNVVIMQSAASGFYRGAFWPPGSISDPEKFYHFEIVALLRPRQFSFRD